MANFPSDIIWDILLLSAVKDLLRFRCVSNFFSSLIDSRDFIKLHLSHSQETKTNIYGIFQKDPSENTQAMIFDITKYVKNDIVSSAIVNLPVSLPPVSNKLKVVGSCNGLIALLNRNSIEDDIDITIWNPFTGKSKKVGVRKPPRSQFSYGFGYDPETDDCKLVKIAESWGSNHPSDRVTYKTAVCSLKTHTWREIGKDWSLQCAYNPCLNEIGVVANNALHWMIPYAPDETKIVAFDLVKEEYYYVPTIEGWKYCSSLSLSVMDGCLSLTGNDYYGTYVWIMKEHGVKESWTNLLYFRWPPKLCFCPYTRPLAYF